MSYLDLGSHYRMMFQLHRYHQYNMEYLEGLFPFERDLYIDMVLNAVSEEKELQSG